MQILIHTGDAKCGSSSIQASLFEERQALLEHGILYHPAAAANGHYSYFTLLMGRTRGDDSEQADLARQNIGETTALLAQHAPDYLLLSAENLFAVDPEQIIGLLTEMLGATPDIHVISFLRHPVDFYLSTVQQQLKADHEFPDPAGFSRDMAGPCRNWRAQPCCKSVSVRLFNRDRMANGSVVQEFAAILRELTGLSGISLPDTRENTSLSAEQIIILQRFRRRFCPGKRGKFVSDSTKIVRLFNEMNAAHGGLIGTRPALLETVQACIQERNAALIAEVDEMFPHLQMAQSRPVAPLDWRPDQPNWNDKVASILKSYDPALINGFTRMIPHYDPAMSKGRLQPAFKALAKLDPNPSVKRAYEAYLERTGLLGAGGMFPRNILILGTSNSIIRGGWTTGFGQALPSDVKITNASIGDSPGSQFASVCHLDLSEYDCIIMDSIVNDENMMQRGHLGAFDQYAALLFQIMSTLASQSRLVVLGFCNERHAQNRSRMYRLHRDIARKLGAPFLSVIDFALERQAPWFRDGAHISLPIARDFGSDLAQKITALPPGTHKPRSFRQNFSTLHVKTLSSAECVTRESRIFKQDFVRLKAGDNVRFDPPGTVIGFQIDSHDTYGFVEFESADGKHVQSLRYELDPDSLLAFFVPVADGVPARRMTVLDHAEDYASSMHESPLPRSTPVTRVPSVQLRRWLSVFDQGPQCRVAISTVTFWNGNAQTVKAKTEKTGTEKTGTEKPAAAS